MTTDELKNARKTLKMNQAAMAVLLDTPYRTYQDWEAGKARIPGVVGVAMRLLRERDKWVMAKVLNSVDARVAMEFPDGIPSERFDIEEERWPH